eukprot:gene14741-19814_t
MISVRIGIQSKRALPLPVQSNVPKINMIRFFSAEHKPAAPAADGDVVIPDIVDTLEWVLDSPPNVHQFEEPPIVVEIEHLKNLIVPDH